MWSFIRFLLMVLVTMSVWIGISLGVGFVLHRLIPTIDLGIGTLIAVVALGGSFQWLSRISALDALYSDDDSDSSETDWSTTHPTTSRSTRRKRRRRRS